MRKLMILLMLVASSAASNAQNSREAKTQNEAYLHYLQRRIDSLICIKKYKHFLDKEIDGSYMSIRPVIKNGIATYKVGNRTSKSLKGYVIEFTVLYDLKKDQIISVTDGG